MTIQLGDLELFFDANVQGLEKATKSLQKVSQQMDKAAKRIEKSLGGVNKAATSSGKAQTSAANATEKAMLRQRRAVNSAREQYLNLDAAIRRQISDLKIQATQTKAGSTEQINLNKQISDLNQILGRTTRSFNSYQATLSKGALSTSDFAARQDNFRAVLGRSRRGLGDFNHSTGQAALNTLTFKNRMTNLSKSVQLALGPLSGVAARVNAFSGLVTGVNLRLAATIGLIIGAGGLVLALKKASEAVDKLRKTAERTGFAIEDFQALEFAASQAGIGTDVLSKSLERFTRRIGDAARGSGEARRSLQALGFTWQELIVNSPIETFIEFADRLQEMDAATTRSIALYDLFGRSGLQMGNLISQGGDAIVDMMNKARQFGLVIEEDLVGAATKVTDSFDLLGRVITATTRRVLLQAGDKISELALTIAQAGPAIARNIDIITAAFVGLSTALAGFIFGGPVGATIAAVLGGLTTFTILNRNEVANLIEDLGTTDISNLENELNRLKKLREDLQNEFNSLTEGRNRLTFPLKAFGIEGELTQINADIGILEAQLDHIATNPPTKLESFFQKLADVIRINQEELQTLEQMFGEVNTSLINQINELITERDRLVALTERNLGSRTVIPNQRAIEDAIAVQKSLMSAGIFDAQIDVFGEGLASQISEVENRINSLKAGLDAGTVSVKETNIELVKLNRLYNSLLDQQQLAKLTLFNKRMEEGIEVYNSTRKPLETYSEQILKLQDLYENGAIDLDTFNRAMTQSREEFIETDELMKRLSSTYDQLAEGIVEAMTTGASAMQAFRDVAFNVVNDILKEFLKLAIINPIKNAIFGIGLPTLFNIATAPTSLITTGKVKPGFATGGSFDVGGTGSTDSQLVQFMATPGEHVNVSKGNSSNGGNEQVVVVQNINISAGVAQTVRAEMMALMPALKAQAIAGVTEARLRNPGLFNGG